MVPAVVPADFQRSICLLSMILKKLATSVLDSVLEAVLGSLCLRVNMQSSVHPMDG